MATGTLAEGVSRTGPAPPGRRGWVWVWPVLAGVLLGASGLVRAWQDRQLEAAAQAAETAPFPMADLPRTLGEDWKAQGPDQVLDPQTLTVAGASDYVARAYTDTRTGVVLTVLVVFGPAERILGHIPEVCFPATGYAPADSAQDYQIKLPSGPARFRSLVFARGQGPTAEREEVYYGFRHAGRWSPNAAGTRKRLRLEPATYKVQVQRRVGEGEGRGLNNPTESLLAALVPEL